MDKLPKNTNLLPPNPQIEVDSLSPFTQFCISIGAIPSSYKMALTYEEQLLWLCDFLENTIIPTVNQNGLVVTELQELYIELKNYVDNYFTSLDVQDEINNKLDDMAEDGTLENILTNYTKIQKVYNNYYSMIQDIPNLINGMKVKTLGYHSINDGGNAEYYITDEEDSSQFQIQLNQSGLFANLIVKNFVNIKTLGAYGDNQHDDTNTFLKALEYMKNSKIKTLFLPTGEYNINTNLIVSSEFKILGDGIYSTILNANFEDECFIKNENFLNYGNYDYDIEIANLTINKNSINVGVNGKRCFRFGNTKNLKLHDLFLYSNVNSQFGAIDLYTDNKNSILENIEILAENLEDSTLCGGIAIREYSENRDYFTDNIIIKNCKIVKGGIDESLWIDAWRGYIKNVYVDGFYMKDTNTTTATNSIFVGGNRENSKLENVLITNSIFEKPILRHQIININDAQTQLEIFTDNIIIDNCIFKCNTCYNNATRLMHIGHGTIGNFGIKIKNSKFSCKDTINGLYSFIISENTSKLIFSENNIFECEKLLQFAFLNVFSSVNDRFNYNTEKTLFRNCQYIINPKFEMTLNYLLETYNTDIEKIYIKDIDYVECTRLIAITGTAENLNEIHLENINCKNSSGLLTSYASNVIKVFIDNLNTDNQVISSTSNFLIYANNLLLNNFSYGKIPASTQDKNNFAVGTVFISSAQGKSIVRKISEGSSASNWEEI